jgi:hypothetical protein
MSNQPPSGPADPGQPQQGWGQQQLIPPPPSQRSWYKKKRWVIPLGILAFLIIIGIFAPDPEVTVADPPAASTATTTVAAAPPAKKAVVAQSTTEAAKPMPEAPKLSVEDQFISLVEQARDAADNADNDFRKRLALTKRNDSLCELLETKRIQDWTGEVKTLDTNGDGLGVLKIQIADDIKVGTWNNALSDISDDTLIKKNSAVFETMASLNEGDQVKFSGTLISDPENCIGEQSITDNGSTKTPSFTIRFSKLAKN